MDSSMRKRVPASKKAPKIVDEWVYEKRNERPIRAPLLPEYVWVIVFALNFVLFSFIHLADNSYPEPKFLRTAKPGEFVEERAREHLLKLTSFGQRSVGSQANEVHSVKYLTEQLNQIKSNAKPAHKFDVDVQTVSGTFTLEFLGHFTSVYENVNNILVKMGPHEDTGTSLLVNCHYDTAIGSPGASDDAVSCCVMLEILQVLTQQDESLPHSLIFNFNGAEENVLQAAHGFITQHPWASSIKAFVNLEAAGAGGRELVFQTGPEHPWLIQAYASAADHPYASVVGQEVFQSGIIPSDTDFRIYRDYAHIPGIDIAYISNGYVYHTMHDTPDKVPPGCMQRGGENVLKTIQTLLASPYLEHPGDYRHGNMVFFDVVGTFMISYPERLGEILNLFTVLLVFWRIGKKVASESSKNLHGLFYVTTLVKALLCILMSWAAAVCTVIGVAGLLMATQCTMAWYGNHLWVVGLYVCPAVAVSIALHAYFKTLIFEDQQDEWELEDVFFDASLSVWTMFLIILTYNGLGSAYFALLWTLLPILIRGYLAKFMKITAKGNLAGFMLLHFVAILFPNLMSLYGLYGLFEMFVPVLGRIGTEVYPDVAVAGMSVFAVIVCMLFQLGLVYTTHSVRKILSLLTSMSVIALLLVIFTPFGFPYQELTPQKSVLHHIERRFHTVSGNLSTKDSGLWYIPFDQPGTLSSWQRKIPRLEEGIVAECKGPYCGWPYYYPMLTLMKQTYYIPSGELKDTPRGQIKLVSREDLSDSKQMLTFQIEGPDHMTIFFQPKPWSHLVKWSMGDGNPLPCSMPPEAEGDHYFVFYSYGTKPKKPYQFWIELEITADHPADKGFIDIAIAAHHVHEKYRETKELVEFLNKMPKWTFTTNLTSTFDNYIF
ncbi:endoplasmic reticulum metallopeptidase 1-like [Lingula anatina]|uniref:Endoplasmic reticulum metallopeptidase 1-like n=1 Tax=Lingula anatina TaxID=7574 RepID=A0A1S3IMM2_LINAN|nr:endoplasmic reticulum metallopeptidase 1-like [Lingula anatina]|eukprot:XP_013399485.1 endoplasmic reticulum metallopeptidase 1-like [Lingula anatina]